MAFGHLVGVKCFLLPATTVVVARMVLEKMTTMTVFRKRTAKRLLTLNLRMDVRLLVRQHHVGLHSAKGQTAPRNARRADRLRPTFPNLPNVDILDEENGGSNPIRRTNWRV